MFVQVCEQCLLSLINDVQRWRIRMVFYIIQVQVQAQNSSFSLSATLTIGYII